MTDTLKRGAVALVQYETSGMCKAGQKCEACDCGCENMSRDELADDLRRNMDRVRYTLEKALSSTVIARAIHNGPNAQAQYAAADIDPHPFEDCPYQDQYLADADAVIREILGD